MALDPLATADDLAAYGITYDPSTEQTKVDRFLASASTAVRDAAGVPISRATSTVPVTALPGGDGEYLPLPGAPIISVSTVLDETSALVTGWKLVHEALWWRRGWVRRCEPTTWTVTQTHGLAAIPEDIVGYVCVLVAGALTASRSSTDGSALAPDPAVASFRIDDYSEAYVDPADRPASPFDLPERVREELRVRFGGGTYVVGSR